MSVAVSAMNRDMCSNTRRNWEAATTQISGRQPRSNARGGGNGRGTNAARTAHKRTCPIASFGAIATGLRKRDSCAAQRTREEDQISPARMEKHMGTAPESAVATTNIKTAGIERNRARSYENERSKGFEPIEERYRPRRKSCRKQRRQRTGSTSNTQHQTHARRKQGQYRPRRAGRRQSATATGRRRRPALYPCPAKQTSVM